MPAVCLPNTIAAARRKLEPCCGRSYPQAAAVALSFLPTARGPFLTSVLHARARAPTRARTHTHIHIHTHSHTHARTQTQTDTHTQLLMSAVTIPLILMVHCLPGNPLQLFVNGALISLSAEEVRNMRPKFRVILVRFIAKVGGGALDVRSLSFFVQGVSLLRTLC
eukprot:1154692-Pelagomonas_calceolata.AAC.2